MQIIAYAKCTANRPQLAFSWCRNPQKLLSGRRLRRRPCIYVMAAGSDGARIKRKIEAAVIVSANTQHSFRLKKEKASANKLPAGNIFLLYGQYLNLSVTNKLTGNQYLLYSHCPNCPRTAPTSRGRVFCIKELFIYNILYIYIYYILYIVYFIIFILYPQWLPHCPGILVTLYREIKIKKIFFFFFYFFYIYITFFRAGRGVGAASAFSTIFILSICVFLINIAKFCRKNAAPHRAPPPAAAFCPAKNGASRILPHKNKGARAPLLLSPFI